MVADGAEHPRLQVTECDVVGKTAGVDLGVMVAVRIAAAVAARLKLASSSVRSSALRARNNRERLAVLCLGLFP